MGMLRKLFRKHGATEMLPLDVFAASLNEAYNIARKQGASAEQLWNEIEWFQHGTVYSEWRYEREKAA